MPNSENKETGTSNNIQRYFCHKCHKTFSFKNKLDPIKIWIDYTSGKKPIDNFGIVDKIVAKKRLKTL